MVVKSFVYLFLLSFGEGALVIPEELPSLLSVAYSNIPPIKKGTDSRVGFGFAFGNHADFQLVFELGPQTNTQNLTGQPFPSSGNTKRQASGAPAPAHQKLSQTDASKYLQNWAQNVKHPSEATARPAPPQLGEVPNLEESVVELVKNDKGEYEIHQPQPGNIPHNVLNDLKKLYKQNSEAAKKMGARTQEDVKRITEDLSNVDLD